MIPTISYDKWAVTAYILNLVTVTLTCTPVLDLQNIGFFTGTIALILAYIVRNKAEKNSAAAGHGIYLVRTIWVWSALLLVSLVVSEIIIFTQGNTAALDQLTHTILAGIPLSADDIGNAMDLFLADNEQLIMTTLILWCAPAQIYAFWRTIKGLSRAMKGYRLDNPSAWL